MSRDTFLRVRAMLLAIGFALAYPLILGVALLQWVYTELIAEKKCKNIAGDVAVITGAARGLGKCIAEELAAKGCHVAIVDVRKELAEETAKAIREKYNVKAKAYEVDVTQPEQIIALNENVTQDIGMATILVNNAGILIHTNQAKPKVHEIKNMVNVNYMAHFLTNQVFLENMKKAKKGHIMAISSISGLITLTYSEPYCSTKHAVRTMMRIMRAELTYEGFKDIHTTTVFPNFLQTNAEVAIVAKEIGFTDLYPLISGEEMAQRAVLGMLRNEVEVAEPSFFLLIYRLNELLPTKMQDFIAVEPMRLFDSFVQKVVKRTNNPR